MSSPARFQTAVCRWCRQLIPATPDASSRCPSNTTGCGTHCGFGCGCDPDTWDCGPHEPTVMGYSITHQHGDAVFLLKDQDSVRAVEWRMEASGPTQIVHHTMPVPGIADHPMACAHGLCYPVIEPLTPALAKLYNRASTSFDQSNHEQVFAVLEMRWRDGGIRRGRDGRIRR